MAMLDNHTRTSNMLPSINHVDLDRVKINDMDRPRLPSIPALSISTGTQRSPLLLNSSLPTSHPLSSTSTISTHERPGYISPPESTTRRSTREEYESPFTAKSLPSIHEALGDRSILNPTSSPTSSVRPAGSTLVTATSALPSFPEQASNHSHATYHSNFPSSIKSQHGLLTDSHPRSSEGHDHQSLRPQLAAIASIDGRVHQQNSYPYPASPRASFSSPKANTTPLPNLDASNHLLSRPPHTSQQSHHPHHQITAPSHDSQPASILSYPSNNVQHEPDAKIKETRNSLPISTYAPAYGETVKRHLDVYDTEIAFNEISDASTRTLDFSRYWNQRHHEADRSHALAEGIPPLQDIDDAIRQCHRIMDNLNRVREVSVMQQTTVSEERARLTRLPPHEQYRTIADDYQVSSFAVADAKKRRGKAAPPGRCHSCNRAETPEWRRGPDGARTLCNACGLHYAKLTRKLGANKTGHMTASSLRPKEIDGRLRRP